MLTGIKNLVKQGLIPGDNFRVLSVIGYASDRVYLDGINFNGTHLFTAVLYHALATLETLKLSLGLL